MNKLAIRGRLSQAHQLKQGSVMRPAVGLSQAQPVRVAYCFATDGNDKGVHKYAVGELRRYIPDATCITVSDGGYTDPLPYESVVDCRGEFTRVFGRYDSRDSYTRFPTIAFSRFILPQLTGGKFDKLVYLDNDAIVVSSRFAYIASTDLAGFDVAACIDREEPSQLRRLRKAVGTDINSRYHNSGVLVMRGSVNMDIEKRLADGYNDYLEKKTLTSADQDIMNYKLSVKTIDCRFNMMLPSLPDPNTCCVHLPGRLKGWMVPLLEKHILRFNFS